MKQEEFNKRRRRLMEMMGVDSIAILPAAPERLRNRDVEHRYRQDSDFFYLSGFPEPEAVVVLIPGRPQGEYVLFCRDRNQEMETWHGRRAGPEGACEFYGADDAFPIDDIDDILPGLLEKTERIFYTMGNSRQFDKQLINWTTQLRQQSRMGVHTPGEIISLDHLLHDMRLIKGRAEISLMRKAANISAKAHKRAMKASLPGVYEYQLAAEIEYEFQKNGCQLAYQSIVGGGENSCILHYVENNQPLQDGSLVLIDAGAELDCYASDITRTFPVNGKFSVEQREVYEIVLQAQLDAINQAQVGNHWNQPHEAAVKTLSEGLLSLGLLKGSLDSVIEGESYRKFFMHRTGHWLGMDVHDVGDYKVDDNWRQLEPGMALTVEPGLYIAPGTKGVAKRWWGIGIRIEDDVVVTRKGPDVLSKHAPKTVAEIERWMAS